MAAGVDNKIYTFGGFAGVGRPRRFLNVVEVYDPTQGRWASFPAMPISIGDAGAAVVGSKIY